MLGVAIASVVPEILNNIEIYFNNNLKLQLYKVEANKLDIEINIQNPDEAGQGAVEKVVKLCEDTYLKHYNVRIPPDLGDAGDLSEISVQKLKESLYKEK